MRRAVVAAAAAAIVLGAGVAGAQERPGGALVVVVPGVTFPAFAERPLVPGLARTGGIAMLRGPDPTEVTIRSLADAGVRIVRVADAAEARVRIPGLVRAAAEGGDRVLVVVIGLAPAHGVAAEAPDAVLVAEGTDAELLTPASVRPPTLTSDSTRRAGVVTPADVVTTVAGRLGVDLPGRDAGSPIAIEDAPPPVDLYERYLRYRELSAPVQAGLAIAELVLAAFVVWALVRRRDAPRLRRVALGAVLALPVVFLALLLVGHLSPPTLATVLLAVGAAGVLAGAALVRVADRSGVGAALGWAGGIALAGLAVESALGWTAGFAPMLGGSHLDGARFFGMPNVEIGLALGGATLVAMRLRSTVLGAALIGVAGLWAGSPWLGSNLGAAVTLAAAAGLWWTVRDERGWAAAAVAAAVCAAAGLALVLVAHRVLVDAPTHITRFAASGDGVDGVVGRVLDRLAIGLRLLRDQPPAAIPVVATPIALAVVLRRPPAALRAGFRREPGVRPAAITILLASLVAYLANDTGAAALGLGFGTAIASLAAVSLDAGREKMEG